MLRILRRALEGWDALEMDLAEAAGTGMALPANWRSGSRSATQAIVDALVDIVVARSGDGAKTGDGARSRQDHDSTQMDEGELCHCYWPPRAFEEICVTIFPLITFLLNQRSGQHSHGVYLPSQDSFQRVSFDKNDILCKN